MSRETRLLYTSSPDRGLDVVLELWPEIHARAPDAELAYVYAPVYWEFAAQDPRLAAHARQIEEKAKQPGVACLGALSQPELAKLMRASLVWVHPSWVPPLHVGNDAGAPWHETSCIGAIEAQAAGLHVVASDWGALHETVKVGRLVNSDAPGPRWRRAIVEHVVEGLTNREVQAFAQTEGPAAVADMGWDGVAEQIAGLVERVAERGPGLVSA